MISMRTVDVDGRPAVEAGTVQTCLGDTRTVEMTAVLFEDLAGGELLVTDPDRGWIASVLPGEGPGGVADVLIFSLDPADEWRPEYQRWAEAVESEFVVDPAAA